MSLINSYSVLDNKLERHEQRERALGEIIKKSLVTLQRGQRLLEPLKGSFDRLEERVSQIETLFLQRDETNEKQQKKLAEALGSILEFMIAHTDKNKSQVDSSSDEDDEVTKKIDELSDNIKLLRKEIAEIKSMKKSDDEVTKKIIEQTEKLVNTNLNSANDYISKIDKKLSSFYVTNGNPSSGAATTTTVDTQRIDEWENKVEDVLIEIKSTLNSPKAMQSQETLQFDKKFFEGIKNETLAAIENMKTQILESSDKNFAKTSVRIKENNEVLTNLINELSKKSIDIPKISESISNGGLSNNDSEIIKANHEIIKKLDKVLLETSNNVLDTRRRVEFGIHQIVLEVSDNVKENFKDVQKSLIKR